jgi:hypothetical protein
VVEVDGSRRHVTYYLHWNKQAPGFADINHIIELAKLWNVVGVVFEEEMRL